MFTQASRHGLAQLLPDASGIPVVQAPPTSHAAAVPKGLGALPVEGLCAARTGCRLGRLHHLL
jgi:hypothetical protein